METWYECLSTSRDKVNNWAVNNWTISLGLLKIEVVFTQTEFYKNITSSHKVSIDAILQLANLYYNRSSIHPCHNILPWKGKSIGEIFLN